MIARLLKIFLFFLLAVFSTQLYAANHYFVLEKNQPATAHDVMHALPTVVLKSAINAYDYALTHHAVKNMHTLTIVDFDKPSYDRRLWVIDLHNKHLILTLHVAQGGNSGKIYATRFSNRSSSHESSLGIYTTLGHEYYGQYGKSLRLKGLESGINSNAFFRGIVIHSEWDVTPTFIHAMGYAGRTWGCFAVNPSHIDRLIQLLQSGTVFFVYAKPEKSDPLINHPLSAKGQQLYDTIMHTNLNPMVHFFESL